MDDDTTDGACCSGWTLDVTHGGTNITLHGHALLTPEVLDTLLARLTRAAVAGDLVRETLAQ